MNAEEKREKQRKKDQESAAKRIRDPEVRADLRREAALGIAVDWQPFVVALIDMVDEASDSVAVITKLKEEVEELKAERDRLTSRFAEYSNELQNRVKELQHALMELYASPSRGLEGYETEWNKAIVVARGVLFTEQPCP